MTIQTRWRAQVEGRKARQHFKKMLKHKNALIDMFIYLVFCGLIYCGEGKGKKAERK